MSDQSDKTSKPGKTGQGRGFNRILIGIATFVVLGLLMVVGYLIIDTVLQIRSTAGDAANLPNAVATDVASQFNPTPTIYVDPITVVRQVQNVARLETSIYNIEKVITAESGDGPLGFLFSDRLLLVASGQVIAGVDLERFSEDDIQIAGDTAYITLPAPEIFVATLNNDDTYIYDRQTAPFGQQVDLETLARQEAEAAILEAAIEDGILNDAQQNAEVYLESLIEALGIENVVFINGTPAPDQDRGGD